MRILIVCEDIPAPHLGGLGKHALALAHALAERGHAVDILGNGNPGMEALSEQHGPGRFFGEIVGHDRLWKQKQLGLYHSLARKLNTQALLKPLLRRAGDYDLVHYHGHLPWVAAEIPKSVPFIQTRHDQGGDCMLNTRFTAEEKVCASLDPEDCARCASPQPNLLQRRISVAAVLQMRHATSRAYEQHPVVFVSDFLRSQFSRVNAGSSVGSVIHNAVNTQLLARRWRQADDATADGRLRLFAGGALAAYKGFGPMMEELEARRSSREFRLRIAGAGPLAEVLRQRHASPSIEFLGWSSYDGIIEEVLDADAVLVPSLCDEPCATTVLEALALGKTVYALASGGTPEMLASAGSAGGRLVLSSTMEELAQSALAHVAAPSACDPLKFEISILHMTDALERKYEEIKAARRP